MKPIEVVQLEQPVLYVKFSEDADMELQLKSRADGSFCCSDETATTLQFDLRKLI